MSEISTNDISRILRGQAWQRAKGELMAMRSTYYSPSNASPEQLPELIDAIDEFIEKVESEGLHY